MTRTIEVHGGLGDVLYDLYLHDSYTKLDQLQEHERMAVTVLSTNPGVKELFLWHPKAAQLDVHDVGFFLPWGPEERAQRGLSEPEPRNGRSEAPMHFYPSPIDRPILNALARERYVVFSISSSGLANNIPVPLAEKAADLVIERGFKVVVVGRTFAHIVYSGENSTVIARREERLAPRHGVIDVIDKLTVPGTIEAVRRAAAAVCCHSAVQLAAWFVGTPVYAIYPSNVRRDDWDGKRHYSFGRDLPTTGHSRFEDFSEEKFLEWMKTVVETRLTAPA